MFVMSRIETAEPDYSRYVNDFAQVDAFASQNAIAAPAPVPAPATVPATVPVTVPATAPKVEIAKGASPD